METLMIKLIYFIVLILSSTSLMCQQGFSDSYGSFADSKEKGSLRLGVFGNYRLVQYDANFSKLPTVPNCCPSFTGGDATGYGFGALIETTFGLEELFVGLRFQYYKHSGDMKSSESTLVLVDDEIKDGLFEHHLHADFSLLSFEPYISWNIISGLHTSVGFGMGLFSTSKYEQKEVLSQPENVGVFIDTETRERNVFDGDLPDINKLQLSGFVGLSYDLPLNRQETWFLSPSIDYYYGVSDVIKELDWKTHNLSIGLALKYKYNYKETPITIEIKRDTLLEVDTLTVNRIDITKKYVNTGITIYNGELESIAKDFRLITVVNIRTDTLFVPGKPRIDGKLWVYGWDDGNRSDVREIIIQEQFVTQAFHFLPYIFFDANASSISDRYEKITNKNDFSIDSLAVNPILYQEHILNIIGERLSKIPKAKITLIGYTDPTSESVAGCDLAQQRAMSVKKYLVEVWKIESSRIIIPTDRNDCFPSKLTVTQSEEGYSENRRVDIVTDNPELTTPISNRKFLEVISIEPRALEYVLSLKGESKLIKKVDWSLTTYQEIDGAKIYLTLQNELGADIDLIKRKSIVQIINDIFAQQSKHDVELSIELKATSEQTKPLSIIKILHIRKDTTDYEYERLSLAFFDVSGANIREIDKEAIKSFVEDLQASDTVKVYGYTDELGDPNDNKRLAELRASNICNYIKSVLRKKNVKIREIKCQGIGFESKPPQIKSYSTPEERFLSRTVLIEIRRKWK